MPGEAAEKTLARGLTISAPAAQANAQTTSTLN